MKNKLHELAKGIFKKIPLIETQVDHQHKLFWCDSLGIGYMPSNGYSYDEDYWNKYLTYKGTKIEKDINDVRIDFVRLNNFDSKLLCDVGIGNGQFLLEADCKGYDINPHAKKWLIDNKKYANPYIDKFDALSMWDVLEHIDDPRDILKFPDKIFTAIPIHNGLEDCLNSKHLRPGEHIWHFTTNGFRFFMDYLGFILMNKDYGEIRAGRENIISFYFEKKYNK